MRSLAVKQPGTVYLVGGGPGDPGLMTIKGMEKIRAADAILYDALVNPSLLREAKATAELIDVGKRAGQHRMSQTDINRLLIELAYSCELVVRLKGGDPFVFGRGGEEIIALKAAGVPVEVVPGISSAIGALAYAGVPVTHRHLAANFAVVTGHRATGAESDEEYWSAMAKMDTLVILMGMRNLPQITEYLIEAGRDPHTPALAVRWGTLPEQEVVEGTLATLAQRVAESNLTSPAVIVIGAVVGLSPTLGWFAPHPQPALEPMYC